MKYRLSFYLDNRNNKQYFVEYNTTNKDYPEDWFELETIELEDEAMINDIVNLLNSKYGKEPIHKYGK